MTTTFKKDIDAGVNAENKPYFLIKEAPDGFSFTTFFFGFFPALIRGDWKGAGLMFLFNFAYIVIQLCAIAAIASAGGNAGAPTAMLISTLSSLVYFVLYIVICCKYNGWYKSQLMKKGYVELSYQ